MLKHIVLSLALLAAPGFASDFDVGSRPLELIEQMREGPLKDKLMSCKGQKIARTKFSIGHRGAPFGFPEHTIESYTAAAEMGAGILECDVTFTKDKALVCRHAQDDLHKTTDILATDMASACNNGACSTADITLDEFKTLKGVKGDDTGTVVTHAESIKLFKGFGVGFTPELKAPAVEMPYKGMSQQDYAQALIDAYKAADIPAADVWPQSFNLADVIYWIESEPGFGAQAVWLDGSYRKDGWSSDKPASWTHSMQALKDMGLNYIAPPLWVLLTLENGQIVPSTYAKAAKAAGLEIITWTVERSGPLNTGGGWYFQSITPAITGDGMLYEVIDVLAQDVGVTAIFSDWAGTTSYYANCLGMN